MKAWIVRPDFAIGTSAKAGCTSLRKFFELPSNVRIRFEDVKSNLKIGIIRNPVKRFWSLYANIQERKRGHNNFYKSLEGKTPKHVLQALQQNWLHDVHYDPQYLIGLNEVDYLIRLEDCFWLPKENASNKNWDNGDLGVFNRIRSMYREDWDLWIDAEGMHDRLMREHPELFGK